MQITEIFYSIQGEGKFVGMPSVFIRVANCNLRCVWCDTKYASWAPEAQDWPISDIVHAIEPFPTQYVVITGGEPCFAPEIALLTQHLHSLGKHITLETNGTIYPQGIVADLVSISPKLSHSIPKDSQWAEHQKAHCLKPEILKQWHSHFECQFKFVVACPSDLQEIQDIIQQLDPTPANGQILLMPLGTTAQSLTQQSQWVIQECLTHGYRFCTRLHIYLFGERRGI